MYQYFIFNGINSLDMGVHMLKAPSIDKAEKRVNEIEMAGKNGVLHEDLGCYSNYTKTAECILMDRNKLDDVCNWLNGYGEVIFSSEPEKVYRAFIKNQIPFNNVLLGINDFIVLFDVYPLKYSVNKTDEEIELTTGASIYNHATYYSEPIITVYGSGNINLVINGITYVLTTVTDYITINSEVQEVYRDGVNSNSQYTADDFPILQCGDNTISWTGNVTKVKIEPNWRWL